MMMRVLRVQKRSSKEVVVIVIVIDFYCTDIPERGDSIIKRVQVHTRDGF